MTDYVAIALQGFSTGIGVILANEVWQWFSKYRSHVKNEAKNLLNRNGKDSRH
jgi:hypothetical protein